MRRIAIISVVVMTSVAAAASGVWDTKPFTEWTDKDVEKVMTDSPWAGKASITHARPGANRGPVPEWKLIISIRSARPYKQAVVRQQIAAGGTLTPQMEAGLAADELGYVIAISGIPRMFQAQANAIALAAELKRGNKPAIKPTEARILLVDKDGNLVPEPARGAAPGGAPPGGAPAAGPPPGGAPPGGGGRGGAPGGFGGFGGGGFGAEDKSGITATLVLGFPKADPITLQDDEIELSTVIATYNVKKAFKLKDMQIKGVLAL